MVKVDISGNSPQFGVPKPLFSIGGETGIQVHDVSSDGRKFLVEKSANVSAKTSMALITNWTTLVEKK